MFSFMVSNTKLRSKVRQLEKEVEFLENEVYGLSVKSLQKSRDLSELTDKWNSLVRRINAKGGESFLQSPPQHEFSNEDIKKLLMLCHPDKHGGKKMAEEMTAILLTIRS